MKIKIAITGGPSGGKTTLIEAIQKELAGQIAVVAEAASILYKGGFPRKASANGKKHTQRAIYFTQKELEFLVALENKADVIICDRGSLDSIAYWPGDEADFYKSLCTDKKTELARYDWVIHLDTAGEASFDTSNPIRTESYKEALELNEKIRSAWDGHPQRIVISHDDEFMKKMLRAKTVIQMIRDKRSFTEIQSASN